MKHKHLTFGFEIKAVEDDGLFSGYLSVFDEVDSYNEVIKKGAFRKTLSDWKKKKRMPPILWQHDTTQPIGVFTDLAEDERGLKVDGQLLVAEVQRAREAHALMKAGAVSGMSIGFNTVKDQTDRESGVRTLTEVRLWEGSIVTFPAQDNARITDVRSLIEGGELPDLKTFERFLREAGFSKSQAVAIASHGYAYLSRSDSADIGELLDGRTKSVIAEITNLRKP